MIPYLTVFIFAIVEGEIYYTAQCVAASLGKINWFGVMVAGALGGSAGDQLWFYVLRGRLNWLDRFPRLATHHASVRERVSAHGSLMVLVSRFLPGLRTAIPIACAYAGVHPIRFSALNLISAFAWAGAIMLVVVKLGPGAMSAFGLHAWWGPLIPAALVLFFFRWLGRPSRPRRPG